MCTSAPFHLRLIEDPTNIDNSHQISSSSPPPLSSLFREQNDGNYRNEGNSHTKDTQQSTTSAAGKDKHFLLYSRLFQDYSIEGLLKQQLIPHRLTLILSGSSRWFPPSNVSRHLTPLSSVDDNDGAHANAHLIYTPTPNICVESMYSTDEHIFGINSLFGIPRSNWALGGEVFYTGKERSGGLSAGLRYRHNHLINQTPFSALPSPSTTFTGASSSTSDALLYSKLSTSFSNLGRHNNITEFALMVNPMMGHFNTTYTTTVLPGMHMSTGYDWNMFSYESDIGIGLLYNSKPVSYDSTSNTNTAATTNTSNSINLQTLKAKLNKQGLSVRFEAKYSRAVFGVGFQTNFDYHPRRNLSFDISID